MQRLGLARARVWICTHRQHADALHIAHAQEREHSMLTSLQRMWLPTWTACACSWPAARAVS